MRRLLRRVEWWLPRNRQLLRVGGQFGISPAPTERAHAFRQRLRYALRSR